MHSPASAPCQVRYAATAWDVHITDTNIPDVVPSTCIHIHMQEPVWLGHYAMQVNIIQSMEAKVVKLWTPRLTAWGQMDVCSYPGSGHAGATSHSKCPHPAHPSTVHSMAHSYSMNTSRKAHWLDFLFGIMGVPSHLLTSHQPMESNA